MPAEPFRDRYEAAEAVPFTDLSGGLLPVWRVEWRDGAPAVELVGGWVVWPSGARDWHGADGFTERMGRAWIEAERDRLTDRAWHTGDPAREDAACERLHIERDFAA